MARQQQPRPAEQVGIASSSVGGALAVVLPATSFLASSHREHLTQVEWYINATPSTEQRLTAFDGTSSGSVLYQTGVATTGAGSRTFANPLRSSFGNQVTVTLSSASTGTIFLNAYGYQDE